jgi:capsular exopolysaccharide synthesis family protein
MDQHTNGTSSGPVVSVASALVEDHDIDLRGIWNFLLRNRLLIGAVFVLSMGAAAAVSWLMTPVYEAGVSVRIQDREQFNPIELFPGLASGAMGVDTELGVLRSRTLAEDVVDSLELMVLIDDPRGVPRDELLEAIHFEPWATAESFELTRVAPGRFAMRAVESGTLDTISASEAVVVTGGTFRLTPAAAELEGLEIEVLSYAEAVQEVIDNLEVTRPDRLAAILAVRYLSTDTLLVDDVPNLLAHRYIQRRLESQQVTALNTVRFLRGQIDSLSFELTQAEDQLQAFREGEQVVSLQAEASAQVSQLAQMQANRNVLDAERGALQQLMDGITAEAAGRPVRRGEPSPYRRLVAFPSLLTSVATSQLLQSLSTLEDERSTLLRRRTMEDPDVESLTERIEQLEEQLRTIAVTYLQSTTNQVAAYDRNLSRFGTELSRIPAKELAVARLERQTATLRDIYMLLQTRLKESEIAQAAEDPSVRVLDRAVKGPEPVSPNVPINFLIGALFGLVLGVTVAAAKDMMDRTVHTREDVEVATGGLPILGIIPDIERAAATVKAANTKAAKGSGAARQKASMHSRLVTLHATKDSGAEAYRALRTSLRFSRMGEAPKTIVMTSALPRDGKSTTAANLAIALAQQGTRTLLVDADLRRGIVASLFGQPSQPGLSNALVGDVGSRDAFRQVEVGDGLFLHLLTAGAIPPNPAELIASDRMEALLKRLEERYDAIIVDTPPLNLVTDAAVLGVRAGGVILVARASVTDKGALRHAAEVLRGVRANVLGAVLNGLDHGRDGYYGSAYGSYSGHYSAYYGEGRRKGKKETAQV